MSENILELRKISKRFSGVEVLHEVSFSLRPGEVHALLGENGAGKSTLVKVMTGIHQPDGGEIYLNGQPVEFSDPRASLQAGIAAIYQELSLFPDLNVAENIFVGRQPIKAGGRLDWRTLYDEAGKLLASLGVHLDLKQKARNLSIAQQQMVEIARALSINARILIMDEPTSSLTLTEVAELFRLVHRLREDGTAIVFISHRLEELFEIADRVTVLRDGSYVDTRPLQEVSRDDLIRLMVDVRSPISSPSRRSQPALWRSRSNSPRRRLRGHQLRAAQRGDPGHGWADRRRPHRRGAGHLRRGAARPAGRSRWRASRSRLARRSRLSTLGLALVPEDRQLHGLIPPMNITANISLPMLGHYARRGWLRPNRSGTRPSARPARWRCGPTTSGRKRASCRAAISRRLCWPSGSPRSRAS